MALLIMCKDCQRSTVVWNTAQTRCAKCQKARSKAKQPKPLKRSTKPIAAKGKHTKAVDAAVAKWKRLQKPNDQGYYVCYICGKWVDYLMAEHVKSKVRHRNLATDENNLKPVCAECNEAKGSKDN